MTSLCFRLMPAACIFVSAVVVVRPTPAHAQKSPTAQAAYARAQTHIGAGRFAEATTQMEIAVRYEPRFALGWYTLASAARRAGRCDQALFAYRRYMELRPTEPDPFYGTGLCLRTIGDETGAATAFRQYVALDIRPASRPFVDNAKKALAELEKREADARKVSAKPPSAALAAARRARDEGRNDAAVDQYRALLRSEPESPEGHAELGAILVANHQNGEAVPVLRKAVRLAPAAATAWYNLAFALRDTGSTEEAVTAYRRYISLRPKDPDPYYGLGRALVSVGRPQEALIAFKLYAALETRPSEGQWVRKARAEVARLEALQQQQPDPTSPAAEKPSRPPPSATSATTPPSIGHAPSSKPDRHGTEPQPAASASPAAASPTPTQPPPARQP